MRHFILISKKGRTAGDFTDLMQAGRLDIVCHAVISALYTSNAIRDDVLLSISLNGPPNPPRLIQIRFDPLATLSKKDIGSLIKSALWKYKEGKVIQSHPGVTVQKKSWQAVVTDELDAKQLVYYLDEDGLDVATACSDKESCQGVFVIGDHEGLDKNELKFLKTRAKSLSIGSKVYFTSQVISFLNIWLDRCEKH
jgi:tRNA (pseudouridine54-N1)-methyltransferase